MTALTVVYHDDYLTYDFGPSHPFTPARWKALHELLSESDLDIEWVKPDPISDDDLYSVHSGDFVGAVRAASDGTMVLHPGYFGLETGDVPTFLGMHDASMAVVSGAHTAGLLVAEEKSQRVLQLGGGLHHAMRARAAGFCVYNDAAVAINTLRRRGLRVAYIDIDVHHGDGVQSIFYDSPDVLTVSLHESGHFLFPGTGFVEDLGDGDAYGTSINVPLFPGTDEKSYLHAYDSIVPEVVAEFRPDIILTQNGADAHSIDPLAHLSLTMQAYDALFDRLLQLADDNTDGRMVALLGGGYAFDSTLRIWSQLAHKLAGRTVPLNLPETWLNRWKSYLGHPDQRAWLDLPVEPSDDASRAAMEDANVKTVGALLHHLKSGAQS